MRQSPLRRAFHQPFAAVASGPTGRLLAATLLAAVLLGCRVMPGTPPTVSAPVAGSPPAITGAPSAAADPATAFFERFAQDPPPYRLALDVAIGGASSGTAQIDADVARADYRADVRVELEGLPPRDSEIVYVDGTGYLRESSDDSWIVVPGYRSTPPLNPFLFLDPADFSDAGADAERGGLRRLSSSTWVEHDASLGYQQGGVEEVEFDVWLDAEGVPVAAVLLFDLVGVDPTGRDVALSYEARYTFSDVGADIGITAPVGPASPSP